MPANFREENARYEAAANECMREVVANGRKVRVLLTGTSMLPLLRPGDSVFIAKPGTGGIGVGELVMFESEGGLTLHRIVRKRIAGGCCWFQTAGQSARIADPWIRDEEIVGHAVGMVEDAAGGRRRRIPGGWSGVLWAWRTRIQCRLHQIRKSLANSDFK